MAEATICTCLVFAGSYAIFVALDYFPDASDGEAPAHPENSETTTASLDPRSSPEDAKADGKPDEKFSQDSRANHDQSGDSLLGSELDFVDPAGESTPPPKYPPEELRQGIGGKAILLLDIDSSGAVTGVQIEQGAGNVNLDNAAARAAREWKFFPGTRRGERVSGKVRVPVEFLPHAKPQSLDKNGAGNAPMDNTKTQLPEFVRSHESLAVGVLPAKSISAGCGCSLYASHVAGRAVSEPPLLLFNSETDGTGATMFINGYIQRLKLVRQEFEQPRIGGRMFADYSFPNGSAHIRATSSEGCQLDNEECEVVEYDGALEVKLGSHNWRSDVSGGCGC